MVQMNSRFSLCDHRWFTKLIQHVGMSWKFKELLVDPLTVNGFNGGKLHYFCSYKIDI